MKTLTIMNYKGGVGKTATAVNTAFNLAFLHNKRILLIDCDPQGNASYFFGKYDETKASISGVFAGDYELEKAIRRTKYKNLDIVQADKNLEFAKIYSPIELKEQISHLDGRYDYVIIDCHPTFDMYTQCAIIAANLCIVPVKLDRNSINGLSLFDDHFQEVLDYNPDVEYKVLMTMWRDTRGNKRGLMELVYKNQYPIFKSMIRNSAAVDESTYKRKPLLKCASRSNAAKDYVEFAAELLKEVE